jgi:hypothetical protein
MVHPPGQVPGVRARADQVARDGLVLGAQGWVLVARVAMGVMVTTAIAAVPMSRRHHRRARKPGHDVADR